MKRKKQSYISINSTLKSRLAQLLLGFFLLVNIPFQSFHSLLHEHHESENTAFHSVENEKDACHRRIFHHDSRNGCEHKSHIVKGEKTCEWCKFFPIKDIFILDENTFTLRTVKANFVFIQGEISPFLFTYLSNPPSRGPPVATIL